MRVKKCANCSFGKFIIVVDSTVQLVCDNCGQIYRVDILKRLPDDIEATQNIKISVNQTTSLVQLN